MKNFLKYLKQLEAHIENGQEIKILTLISKLHPDDIADLVDALEEEQKARLFRLLDVETASDVIMAIDDISRELILEDMSREKLRDLVDDMPSDDAADLIGDLPEQKARELLSQIDHDKSQELQKLLGYPEDTAGGIMQTELVAITQESTVQDAINQIRAKTEEIEDLHNVFVTNARGQLVGTLPLPKLILARENTPVGQIMDTSIIYATADMDQEEVAAMVKKYDLISLPVVDGDRQIIGRIMVDDVIDVIQEEDSEDFFRMAGISEVEDVVYSGHVLKIFYTRMPWLVVTLGGTLASGFFLWMYQSNMKDLLALVAFVPVIMAMSGNVGLQSSSIVVRGLATGRVDLLHIRKTVMQELAVGTIIGLLCAAVCCMVGLFWQHSSIVGISVFIAMTFTVVFAAMMGVLVPAFFKKIGVDPAVASGGLVTTANDLLSINIYFLVAMLLIRYFVPR